ncbi:MAG: outer membrane lipoprotein-sorting protein [Mangrovicoccus sp.]
MRVLLILMACIMALPSHAETAQEILQRIDARDRGRDLVWDLSVTLTDRNGGTRNREAKIYYRTTGPGTSEQISVFFAPQNIRNTALLTVDGKSDDYMWLYLPALRKTKRVPAADRGASFVGTDLSNEDVKLGFEWEDYDAQLIETGNKQGAKAALLKIVPKTAKLRRSLGYDHALAWVRLDVYHMVETKFYRRDRLVKEFGASGIRNIQGISTATELYARDVTNNHTTRLKVTRARYNQGLSPEFFSRATLSREVYP